MYQSLNTWLVQMSNIARRLSRLLSAHDGVRIDRPECVDDDFSPDRLNRVDDDGNGTRVQLFE